MPVSQPASRRRLAKKAAPAGGIMRPGGLRAQEATQELRSSRTGPLACFLLHRPDRGRPLLRPPATREPSLLRSTGPTERQHVTICFNESHVSVPVFFPCCSLLLNFFNIELSGVPWWLGGRESACQGRRHGCSPWPGKTASEPLGPRAAPVGPVLSSPGA